jgi:Ran GTPase-activating protein (RanGAP) involved in mRNA processing and transport
MSQLTQLSLVKAGLNEFSIPYLVQLLQSSKRLTNFDISWNSIVPKQMRKLLVVIATNRRLKYINLAWNGIVDNNASEKD